MKRAAFLACGLTLAVVAMTVVAQEMRPDRAIKYRQGLMYAMNVNFGVLGRMVKGEVPYSRETAVQRAKYMAELSAMPWEAFLPVSHAGGRTKAKPEIWQDKAKFDKLAEAMQAEMPKLVAAAQSGDPGQLKSAMGRVGDTCEKCHDAFVNE